MKKLLCLLAALCLLWCAALPAAARAVTPGDVNADGQISASDALLILRQAVGKEKLSGAALQAADVTGKGDPNAADALCVLQKAVGTLRFFQTEKTAVTYRTWDGSRWATQDNAPVDDQAWRYYIHLADTGEEDWHIFVEYAVLCNTFTQWQTFADSLQVHTQTPKESLLAQLETIKQNMLQRYPASYFDEGNALMVFKRPWVNTNECVYVSDLYVADGRLQAEMMVRDRRNDNSIQTSKLYCVEIAQKLPDVSGISCFVRYTQRDPRTGQLVPPTWHTVQYDFPTR